MELSSLFWLVSAWLQVSHASDFAACDNEISDTGSLMQTVATASMRSGQPLHSKETSNALLLRRKSIKNHEVRTSSLSGSCLKFMHIPKTGGTSIDSVNMHQEVPAFDSLMHQTYSRAAAGMNAGEFESKYGSDLGNMYDESHKSLLHYALVWMPSHFQYYHFVAQPDGNICEDLHTAPGYDVGVTNFFVEGGCTVFCAVRDPLSRFISAYEMSQVGPCDPAGFESSTSTFLAKAQEHPYVSGCMFVPQVQFVYGARNQSSASTQFCNRILHTEHLNEEFDALMEEQNVSLTLPETHLMSTSTYSGCLVDQSQVTQAAKDMIYQYYRADYEAFGYDRP